MPEGFPHDCRQFGKYGQQEGRQGKPTVFYSEVWDWFLKNVMLEIQQFQEVLEDKLKVKLIHPEARNSVKAKETVLWAIKPVL